MTDSDENKQQDMRFHTTRWSVVISANDTDSIVARNSLNTLCQTYWYPLYVYARCQGVASSDAEDIVQGFFEMFIRKGLLNSVDRDKGRFRSFLLACIKNYMRNEWQKAKTKKRGGGMHLVSIESGLAEDRFSAYADDKSCPDKLYERSWAMTLLNQVIKELQEDYERKGNGDVFQVLKDSLAERKGDVSRSSQAEALGISEEAVRVAVHRLRKRYQKFFRKAVADTVGHEEDVDAEMQALLRALS